MRKPSQPDLTAKLRQFFDALASTAEGLAAAETGERPITLGNKQGRAVFGYTVRVGLNGLKAERFGDMPPPRPAEAAPAAPAAPRARAPIVDIFEEDGELCIVAELPGVDSADISCAVRGGCLLIETTGAHVYRKSVDLPQPVDPASLVTSCRNGILEARLRVAASS